METAEWKQFELLIIKALHPKMELSVDPLFIMSAEDFVWPVMPHVAARLCNPQMQLRLNEQEVTLYFSQDVLLRRKSDGGYMRVVEMEGTYFPDFWKLKLKARYKSFDE